MNQSEIIATLAALFSGCSLVVSYLIFRGQSRSQALAALRNAHLETLKIGLENPSFLRTDLKSLPAISGMTQEDVDKYSMYIYLILNVMEQFISFDKNNKEWKSLLRKYAKVHADILKSIDSDIRETYSKELRRELSETLSMSW